MTENDRIIENVNASMGMEDMPLTFEDKKRIRDCLEGKKSFQDTVDDIIRKHIKRVMV